MPATNTWTDNEIAGRERQFGFMRRHATLAIRQSAATSLSRTTDFNWRPAGAVFKVPHDCLEMIGASGERFSTCH